MPRPRNSASAHRRASKTSLVHLLVDIEECVLHNGPMNVHDLARHLCGADTGRTRMRVWQLANISHRLVVHGSVVSPDEEIVDPDYGRVYRKELRRLRKSRTPTLAQIEDHCAKLRSQSTARGVECE